MREMTLEALRRIREHRVWKPGKAAAHLKKRKDLGQLPQEATLGTDETIIEQVVEDPQAEVYIYTHPSTSAAYPAFVSRIDDEPWLVMVSTDGVLETAFPVTQPDRYLGRPEFERLGTIEELER